MEKTTTAAALTQIGHLFDSVDATERARLSDDARLKLVQQAQVVTRRAEALLRVLVAEADAAGSAKKVSGVPTTSWLSTTGAMTSGEAAGLVFGGRDVVSSPEVAAATLSGTVSVEQARAVNRVLNAMPEALPYDLRGEARDLLLERAQTTTAKDLEKLGPEILAAVAPELIPSPDDEAARLASQRKRAVADRRLRFNRPIEGSITFDGSLPIVEATQFKTMIESLVAADKRAGRDEAADQADRLTQPQRTFEQRQADALIRLIASRESGNTGRSTLMVTMQEQSLRDRAEQAGILVDGSPISPGELRQMCCDAELVPVVLGSNSEIVDVGQAVRLVTPEIRRALEFRDRGCVFPRCQTPAHQCEAHHIVPWWGGGATSLQNLALLCPFHHALLEPPRMHPPPGGPSASADARIRWSIRMGPMGQPEVIPPGRLDPTRAPLPRDGQLPHAQPTTPLLTVAAEPPW